MDNHPIPQDVTNFQFRLIGDMTLKQFAYLAGGIVVGWLVFILPVFLLIKLPFALFFAGCGVFLAFAPIEGRPADMMVLYFIKALFAPNQYIFRQTSSQPIRPEQKQQTFVEKTKEEVKKENKKDDKIFFQSLPSLTTAVTEKIAEESSDAKAMEHKPIAPATQPIPEQKTLTTKTEHVQDELALAKAKELEETKLKDEKGAKEAHEKVTELQDQMLSLQKEKEELEKRLLAMQQAAQQGSTAPVFTPSTAAPKKESSHVRKIPTQMATSAGMPFVSDTPNLLTGIIRDSRGNILPNILIEVKDKDGSPVRAFKTNNLGQFASATPLLNGTYTISFEDPEGKHTFDSVEITTTGDILLPIEVISVDQRELLRQELFGTSPSGSAQIPSTKS